MGNIKVKESDMDVMDPVRKRFPAQFIAAAISNLRGYRTPGSYLDEARRLGLRILPLDVNASRLAYHGKDDWIRPGLANIAGCRDAAMKVLVQEREANGPFSGLADLLERVPLHEVEAGNLILAGGLGCFDKTRPALLRELDAGFPGKGAAVLRNGRRGKAGEMPQGLTGAFGPGGERDFCLLRKCLLESELLGSALSADLRDALDIHDSARGAVQASDLYRHEGRRVRVAGIPLTQRLRREFPGAESAGFLSLGDATGDMEIGFGSRCLEPWNARECGGEPFSENLLEVTGMVRGDEGECWVEAETSRFVPWLPGFTDFGIASLRLEKGLKTFPAYAEGAGSLAA